MPDTAKTRPEDEEIKRRVQENPDLISEAIEGECGKVDEEGW